HAADGRNFLAVHKEPYDVITIDPAPPLHSAGSVNLYSREFFGLCKERLAPGGVFCMWVPVEYESQILMVARTFLDVFPEGSMWGGLKFHGFYLVGAHRSTAQTPEQLKTLYEKLAAIEDLGEWGGLYRDPANYKNLYLLDAAGLKRLVGDAPVVTDDRPYTEFPLWRTLFTPAATRVLDSQKVVDRSSEVWRGK
ncbi:MAG: spermidine synthase, partial [Planctomycetia bacterium]